MSARRDPGDDPIWFLISGMRKEQRLSAYQVQGWDSRANLPWKKENVLLILQPSHLSVSLPWTSSLLPHETLPGSLSDNTASSFCPSHLNWPAIHLWTISQTHTWSRRLSVYSEVFASSLSFSPAKEFGLDLSIPSFPDSIFYINYFKCFQKDWP